MHHAVPRACRQALCALTLACAATAHAQTYPAKPVRVVVGFATGGPTDLIARVLAPRLSAAFGQSFVVENRAGADSLIASELVAKSEPDGHVITVISTGHAVNQTLYRNITFDAYRDFAGITLIGDVPNLVMVHPSIPAKTLPEFVTLAKRRKGELTYAASASITHLATELLNKAAGIETVRIAYKGAGPAIVGIISGETHFMVTGIGPVLPHMKSGKLRAIAVTAMKRSAHAPEVPTADESGLPKFVTGVWYAALAPAKTPRPIIDRLNAEFRRALADPDVRASLASQAFDITPTTPDEMQEYLRTEIAKWGKAVRDSGARIE